jgi:hypothetical protein
MLTVVALVNGSRAGSGSGAEDDILGELMTPLVLAVDSFPFYIVKPEIAGDRLLAAGSPTEAHYAELLFDWAEVHYSALFPVHGSSQQASGYRYRYYPSTDRYLGVRDGLVWLYQPGVSSDVNKVGTMVDFIPTAIRDSAATSP